MKSLEDYITGLTTEYKHRIRMLIDLEDNDVDRLERHLKKYDIKEMSVPQRTVWQTNAIGFAEPVNSEVLIIDITLALPVSSHDLKWEIARLFNISRNKICVHLADAPIGDIVNAEEDEVEKEYESKLQTDPEYPEDKDSEKNHKYNYGDEYNSLFMQSLDDARKEARNYINRNASEEKK